MEPPFKAKANRPPPGARFVRVGEPLVMLPSGHPITVKLIKREMSSVSTELPGTTQEVNGMMQNKDYTPVRKPA
jgi:hypothetical protein